jgi:hypothetical protein
MKKIMFNDKYGLTQAVLDGRKTMTRRVVKELEGRAFRKMPQIVFDEQDEDNCFLVFKDNEDIEPLLCYPAYKIAEVVAVAQSYKDISETVYGNDEMWRLGFERDVEEKYELLKEDIAGWTNKMFVRAELMPHQIRIKNVRIEQLQDISDEDCIREGIFLRPAMDIRREFDPEYTFGTGKYHAAMPKAAFAVLIDATCGQGTWQSNPWVFVYEFELLKLDDHE